MRKIVAACLTGFAMGILQSLYFSVQSATLIEIIASPIILLSTVVGFGSGLAATETNNPVVNLITGILIGLVVYSFLGYYSGMYIVAACLGILSGVVSAFIAYSI
ncbi:hypothetical protein SDC9_22982 [bioreactor metagenome]|uniref:Uncharacterized protein n=1 Tax=bioreactor metagenome TaxID=1076179 RepID=A0A644UE44_9ZZZZ